MLLSFLNINYPQIQNVKPVLQRVLRGAKLGRPLAPKGIALCKPKSTNSGYLARFSGLRCLPRILYSADCNQDSRLFGWSRRSLHL